MKKIVWNGCDGYIETEHLVIGRDGWDGKEMITLNEAFKAFPVDDFDGNTLPKDADGDPIIPEGIFYTETGHWYKERAGV